MPKGWNNKAITGARMFLEGCSEVVLQEIAGGKDPNEVITEELAEIERQLGNLGLDTQGKPVGRGALTLAQELFAGLEEASSKHLEQRLRRRIGEIVGELERDKVETSMQFTFKK